MNKKILFFKICFHLGLFSISQRLFRNKLLILCYHGFELEDEASWWPGVFISRETLSARMALLESRGFQVLSLNDALTRMYENRLPHNSIVITVDDGFKSTVSHFFPVIELYQYPATIYLTTYYVQKQTPIYRLVVQYMFWKTTQEQLLVDKPLWTMETNVSADLTNPQVLKRISWEIINFGEQQATDQQRQGILFQLGELLAVSYQDIIDRQSLTLMSVEEVRQLAQAGIDIQLHTHRHHFPNDKKIAIKELQENAAILATCTNLKLNHFCYPSGIWSQNQSEWLKSLAIDSATTIRLGFNDANSNPYGLNRYLDRADIPEVEFLAEITGFSSVVRQCRDLFKGILRPNTEVVD